MNTKYIQKTQHNVFNVNLSNVINSQPDSRFKTHYEVSLQSVCAKKFWYSCDSHNNTLTLQDKSTSPPSPPSYTNFSIEPGSYENRNDLAKAFGDAFVNEMKRLAIVDSNANITTTPQVSNATKKLEVRLEGLTEAQNKELVLRISVFAEQDYGDAGELLGLGKRQNVNDESGGSGFIITEGVDENNNTPYLLVQSPFKCHLFTLTHVFIGCSNTGVNSSCGMFSNRQKVNADAQLTTCIGRALIDRDLILFDAYNVDESTLLLRGGDVLDTLSFTIFDQHGEPLPRSSENRNDNDVQLVLCIEEFSVERHSSLTNKTPPPPGGDIMIDMRGGETRPAHQRLAMSSRKMR